MSGAYGGDLYTKLPLGVCSLIRPLTPEAKLAFWAIINAPNGWRHPGLYQAGPGYLVDENGMDIEAAHEALAAIERAGLAAVDREARLVYVAGWANLRSLDNPNTVVAVARDLRSLPASPLVTAYGDEVCTQLAAKTWKLPDFADQPEPAVALFRHHLKVGGTVSRTVTPTVTPTVTETNPPTVGVTDHDHDHDDDSTRHDEDKGEGVASSEGAGAPDQGNQEFPPVDFKEAQTPEPEPILPAGEKWASPAQVETMETILREAGSSLAAYLKKNGRTRPYVSDWDKAKKYKAKGAAHEPMRPYEAPQDYDPPLTPEQREESAQALAVAKRAAARMGMDWIDRDIPHGTKTAEILSPTAGVQ